MADLFAANGRIVWGEQTIEGHAAIARWLAGHGAPASQPGALNTELIDDPLVNLSVDGLSAEGAGARCVPRRRQGSGVDGRRALREHLRARGRPLEDRGAALLPAIRRRLRDRLEQRRAEGSADRSLSLHGRRDRHSDPRAAGRRAGQREHRRDARRAGGHAQRRGRRPQPAACLRLLCRHAHVERRGRPVLRGRRDRDRRQGLPRQGRRSAGDGGDGIRRSQPRRDQRPPAVRHHRAGHAGGSRPLPAGPSWR